MHSHSRDPLSNISDLSHKCSCSLKILFTLKLILPLHMYRPTHKQTANCFTLLKYNSSFFSAMEGWLWKYCEHICHIHHALDNVMFSTLTCVQPFFRLFDINCFFNQINKMVSVKLIRSFTNNIYLQRGQARANKSSF